MRALTFIFMLAFPIAAFAHAHLASSEITREANGDATLHLKFTEEIEPTLAKIEIKCLDDAKFQTSAKPTFPEAAALNLALGPAKAGTYEIKWAVTAKDTHKSKGETKITLK